MPAPPPPTDSVFQLRCRDRVLDARPFRAAGPLVMGVLNVTPDSFFDGGRHVGLEAALRHAEQMLTDGADILDIGGESTRPRGAAYGDGATPVEEAEEQARVVPVVEAIQRRFPEAVLSVDTYKPAVARAALEAGAHLVNDVTGARYDDGALRACAEHGAAYVAMHSVGQPGAQPHGAPASARGTFAHGTSAHEMGALPVEPQDVLRRVAEALSETVAQAEALGVASIAVDPGVGFGKTTAENLRLIARSDALLALGRPVLIGLSRKSVVGRVLGSEAVPLPVDERLFGSVGGAVAAVMGGASIVRVHDVGPTVDAVRFAAAALSAGLGPDVGAPERRRWAAQLAGGSERGAAR